MAFDRQSARSIDVDGRLHVAKTNISKAVVNPYYGREIPNWQGLGLSADKVYRLYRDPEELAKGATTFNNLPILNKHIPVTVDEPQKDNVVGSIGSDVAYDAPYLQASLCIWDASAIAGVETEQQCELSCGYRYDPDMTPGTTPDGEAYDGVMRNIRGNHLALVECGRAGPDVIVADHQTVLPQPRKENPAMKMTKLGKALFVSLKALSPKIAQDSALPALVGEAKKQGFNKAAITKGLLAMDNDIDAEKADEIIDAVIGVEDTPEAIEPEKEVAKDGDILGFLADKLSPEDLEYAKSMLGGADDEVPEMQPDVQETVTAAMDSMRAEFRQLEQAKVDVRSVVGDVLGMDSAESVYRFALDHMSIEHKDMPAAGLRTMFNAVKDRQASSKPQPQLAQDAKETADRFNLGRFGRA